MTTLIYIARIPSAKTHGPCSCCLIFSRFLPLCRCWRGQECKTEAIIAPRNGDVKVWDPSASRAHPPRQRYEPLAKARTTPLTRIPQRGEPRDQQTFNCLDVATRVEITISKPNPQRKLLQALGTVVVCARIEFASSPGWPGRDLVECPPNNQVAALKRAGGKRKKLHECDKQPSYMPCSKGRSVSVSALFHRTQLVHWLMSACGGILP